VFLQDRTVVGQPKRIIGRVIANRWRHPALDRMHGGERQQVRQRRFGALVAIEAIGMDRIAAASGQRVEDRDSQIIAAKEPVEGALGHRSSPVTAWAARHASNAQFASMGC